MRVKTFLFMMMTLLPVLLVGCGAEAGASLAESEVGEMKTAVIPTPRSTVETITQEENITAPTSNLTDTCVEAYHEDIDYFPDKVTIDEAAGLEISYHNHYKVVHVTTPWRDADTTFRYILVQCGTPVPSGFEEDLVITVPVNTLVSTSVTHLPHLDELGEIDSLVGLDSFLYASNPAVRQKIEAGELVEIGFGAEVNVEAALDLAPDLVMTYGYGTPEYDTHPVLLEAGIPTVLNSGYMEDSPLGRAEWIKFTAVFFNKEAQAQEVFAVQQSRYQELTALTADLTTRPTVFANAPTNETWRMPGGRSYMARFLADAGADYLWSEDGSSGTIPLDFETVFEGAAQADYWINPGRWQTLAEGLAEDERVAEFAAFQNGNLFNNNARLNENGGNEYWELGIAHPELVLADLIKIFHPDLVPDHEFIFYQRLGDEDGAAAPLQPEG